MLKSQFPIIFDSTTIPFFPSNYDRSDSKVSVVNQTENGHDDVELIRVEKTTFNWTFRVNAHWAAIFEGFRRQASIEVQVYNKRTGAYETKTMRIEDYSESMEQYSDRSNESMGLYTIQMTLEEF